MGPKPNDGKDGHGINYVSILITPKIEELCNGVNSQNKNRNSNSRNLFILIDCFFSCPALKMSVSISHFKGVITAITNLPYTGEQLPSGFS